MIESHSEDRTRVGSIDRFFEGKEGTGYGMGMQRKEGMKGGIIPSLTRLFERSFR